jgi:hypothetical protein
MNLLSPFLLLQLRNYPPLDRPMLLLFPRLLRPLPTAALPAITLPSTIPPPSSMSTHQLLRLASSLPMVQLPPPLTMASLSCPTFAPPSSIFSPTFQPPSCPFHPSALRATPSASTMPLSPSLTSMATLFSLAPVTLPRACGSFPCRPVRCLRRQQTPSLRQLLCTAPPQLFTHPPFFTHKPTWLRGTMHPWAPSPFPLCTTPSIEVGLPSLASVLLW